MKDNTKKQIGVALWAILAVGLSALMSFLFTDTDSIWYASLSMPAFMPPPWVFTVVWIVAYILLATALWRQIKNKNCEAVWGFVVILTLCALWNYAFFVLHNSLAALVILILCVIATVNTIRQTWKTDTLSTVALLLFLGWITFATVLNYFIYMAN